MQGEEGRISRRVCAHIVGAQYPPHVRVECNHPFPPSADRQHARGQRCCALMSNITHHRSLTPSFFSMALVAHLLASHTSRSLVRRDCQLRGYQCFVTFPTHVIVLTCDKEAYLRYRFIAVSTNLPATVNKGNHITSWNLLFETAAPLTTSLDWQRIRRRNESSSSAEERSRNLQAILAVAPVCPAIYELFSLPPLDRLENPQISKLQLLGVWMLMKLDGQFPVRGSQ